jgi:hypothetical protein
VECCIWSIASYGAETGTLWKIDKKYVQNFLSVVLERDGEDQ